MKWKLKELNGKECEMSSESNCEWVNPRREGTISELMNEEWLNEEAERPTTHNPFVSLTLHFIH